MQPATNTHAGRVLGPRRLEVEVSRPVASAVFQHVNEKNAFFTSAVNPPAVA
jgi:hypothetical protein